MVLKRKLGYIELPPVSEDFFEPLDGKEL